MVAKCLFAMFGCAVTGIWFFSDELFFDGNIIFRFKCFGVACKISVGDAEQFLKRIKIGRIVDHQYRHNAEPDAVIKSLVDILDDVFQMFVIVILKSIISCRI